jgi:glycosyltransferase involved in cell wall biosynthesis
MINASVIIPCNYDEPNLMRAILSLDDQDLKFEILIGLDGGNELIEDKIINSSIPNLKLIKFPKGTGISKILNHLILSCNGEYIVRMDADDVCLPGRLKFQLGLLSNMSDVLVLCGNAINFDGIQIGIGNSRVIKCSEFLRLNPIIHPTVIFRSSLLLQNFKFFYNSRYIKSQDYEFWTRIVRNYKIYYDSSPILRYNSNLNFRKFTLQHYYFSLANIKNLSWHLNPSNTCTCTKKEIALALISSHTILTNYLKVLAKYVLCKR